MDKTFSSINYLVIIISLFSINCVISQHVPSNTSTSDLGASTVWLIIPTGDQSSNTTWLMSTSSSDQSSTTTWPLSTRRHAPQIPRKFDRT